MERSSIRMTFTLEWPDIFDKITSTLTNINESTSSFFMLTSTKTRQPLPRTIILMKVYSSTHAAGHRSRNILFLSIAFLHMNTTRTHSSQQYVVQTTYNWPHRTSHIRKNTPALNWHVHHFICKIGITLRPATLNKLKPFENFVIP